MTKIDKNDNLFDISLNIAKNPCSRLWTSTLATFLPNFSLIDHFQKKENKNLKKKKRAVQKTGPEKTTGEKKTARVCISGFTMYFLYISAEKHNEKTGRLVRYN